MNNYKLVFDGWEKSRTIATDSATAVEVFAALCDFRGLDIDRIQTEYDNGGLSRAYVKDETGDFIALISRL